MASTSLAAVFGPPLIEAARKREDMLSGPGPVMQRLAACADLHCPSWTPLAQALIDCQLGDQAILYHGRPARQYLHHPIRVAHWLLQQSPAVDRKWLTVALLHNVIEHQAGYPFREVPEPLREFVGQSVRTLTVDRSRETDPGYLDNYYAAIAAAGPSLAAIKCFDKLDNTLVLCLLPPSEKKDRYTAQIRRYVLPLAGRTDERIRAFMEACLKTPELIAYDAEFAAQWTRA